MNKVTTCLASVCLGAFSITGLAQGDDTPGSGALADPCNFPHSSEVKVSSTSALTTALKNAKPGQLIRLSAATYKARFKVSVSGTGAKPIILCGPETAVLDGGGNSEGYVFHLSGANYWVLSGFTVKRGKKGVVLDNANHNLLTGLTVRDVGEEAVRIRKFSSDNVLSYSEIRYTGRVNRGFGEGVYIGTSLGQWKDVTGSSTTPDKSDRNRVLNNNFGPTITAEHIDVKEGTSGGEIRGNTFNGRDLSGENYADSWIDLKGNGYRVTDNTGVNARTDGFQLHVKASGWGNNNIFSDNHATVNGPGYGFNIDRNSTGNSVACDNVVQQAASGFANLPCARVTDGEPGGDGVPPEPENPPPPPPAPTPPPPQSNLDGQKPPSGNFNLTKWKLTLPSGSEIQAAQLSNGYKLANVFYTDPATGGMVFQCPNTAGTTENSNYSRSELREMRAGTNSAGDSANNWKMAEGGSLNATLRVDRVSVTGSSDKVGRVIIGQIHGNDSEPIRLYFHQKPGEAKGRIYAAHDTSSNQNSYSPDIIGNASGGGIAPGETFSYEIKLKGTAMTVVIRRPSRPDVSYQKVIDSGYAGDNLYFKAGVYNQNNTGERSDYAKATFFALSTSHP